MATKTFSFEGHTISFDFDSDEKVMVNATEMAKVYKKDVYNFLKQNGTKSYIEAYTQTCNYRFGDEFSPNGKLVKVVRGGEHNGTWMERSVALKFAAWLNPHFEVWVYRTIDEIMFGDYDRLRKKMKEAGERKARIEKLREELQNDPDADERIKTLFELESIDKKEAKGRFFFFFKQVKEFKQQFLQFEGFCEKGE